MTSTTDKPSVLVVLATGKMGTGITDAFLATEKYAVYGTSRNPCHPTLLAKGATPVEFQFGDKESITRALNVSKASVVVLITDLLHIAKKREREVEHAKIIVDACKEAGTHHVILCSNNFAECGPQAANHLGSKGEMEAYLKKESGIACYTILRPGSFFENFDDPVNMNPLKRGNLSDLYDADSRVALVATRDIGKAAVLVADNPTEWNGKTLDCVASLKSGNECAAILSEVSGVPCTYKPAPPRFILKFLLPDLYHMVRYVSDGMPGYDCSDDIKRFRSLIPDAMGPKEWFTAKGCWSDGSRFNEPPPPESNRGIAVYVLLSVPIVILAIVAALELRK